MASRRRLNSSEIGIPLRLPGRTCENENLNAGNRVCTPSYRGTDFFFAFAFNYKVVVVEGVLFDLDEKKLLGIGIADPAAMLPPRVATSEGVNLNDTRCRFFCVF